MKSRINHVPLFALAFSLPLAFFSGPAQGATRYDACNQDFAGRNDHIRQVHFEADGSVKASRPDQLVEFPAIVRSGKTIGYKMVLAREKSPAVAGRAPLIHSHVLNILLGKDGRAERIEEADEIGSDPAYPETTRGNAFLLQYLPEKGCQVAGMTEFKRDHGVLVADVKQAGLTREEKEMAPVDELIRRGLVQRQQTIQGQSAAAERVEDSPTPVVTPE